MFNVFGIVGGQSQVGEQLKAVARSVLMLLALRSNRILVENMKIYRDSFRSNTSKKSTGT